LVSLSSFRTGGNRGDRELSGRRVVFLEGSLKLAHHVGLICFLLDLLFRKISSLQIVVLKNAPPVT